MGNSKIVIPLRSIILFLSVIFLFWFLIQIKEILLFLFASFIIACALYPIVNFMSKKMPRGVAVAIVFIIGFILILTVLVPVTVISLEQTNEFVKQLPNYWAQVEQYIQKLEFTYSELFSFVDLSQILSTAGNLSQNIVSKGIDFTINIFSGIIAAFTLAIIVLFMLLDGKKLKEGFLKFFPKNKQKKTEEIILTIAKKVGGYVRGQLAIMLLVGILTTIGLLVIGLDFALLLGLVAGILEVVPIIGPFLAAAPAVIIAIAKAPILIFPVMLVYFIVQRLENHLISPLILSKFLEMHPLIIIVAILIAIKTLGVIGVILSPAIAAVGYVLVQELYIKKIN